MNKKKVIVRSFGTHDGTFHADEVTACALLLLFDLIDFIKIVRTRDRVKLSSLEFVCDVGGVYDPKEKRFDHHQVSYQGDLSSAGMVLKYLKEEKVIEPKLYDYFNHALIMGVDAIDNGKETPKIGHASFSTVVASFIPVKSDEEGQVLDAAFHKALEFTLQYLSRLLARFSYIEECRGKIQKEMDRKEKLLIFEDPMPWMDAFFDYDGEKHPALFIIMPANGQWKLRGIPPSLERRMEVRFPLPQKWAGLDEKALKEETKIPGAVFCHKGRFISIWETKEDALKAAGMVLKGVS